MTTDNETRVNNLSRLQEYLIRTSELVDQKDVTMELLFVVQELKDELLTNSLVQRNTDYNKEQRVSALEVLPVVEDKLVLSANLQGDREEVTSELLEPLHFVQFLRREIESGRVIFTE